MNAPATSQSSHSCDITHPLQTAWSSQSSSWRCTTGGVSWGRRGNDEDALSNGDAANAAITAVSAAQYTRDPAQLTVRLCRSDTAIRTLHRSAATGSPVTPRQRALLLARCLPHGHRRSLLCRLPRRADAAGAAMVARCSA